MKASRILQHCLHKLYRSGLTTASGGNISMLEEDGGICISPSQVDKGFLKESDFSYLTINGKTIGEKRPSMEYRFHLSIYKEFSEAGAICHIHPPVLVALSLMAANDPGLKSILEKFKLAYAPYAIPGSVELSEKICEAFGAKPVAVLMQNHGIVAFGKNIDEAVAKIEKLNNEIIRYFSLENILNTYCISKIFSSESSGSIEFYKNRACNFLSIEEAKLEIVFDLEEKYYHSIFKLKSISDLDETQFSPFIIPESFLILRVPERVNGFFEIKKLKIYLNAMSSDHSIKIFKDGFILIKGKSLFDLYDKMEVLDFTARVILIAQKMGSLNALTQAQMVDLKQHFLV
ncbi:MAG: class II aldolase/adducin family protein [Bacteroidetes bacterium]|nr:class II aldolase/adducin family protein [Bacteroidota bacterium]